MRRGPRASPRYNMGATRNARHAAGNQRPEESAVDFNTQYQSRKDDVFREIVRESLQQGLDPAEQARVYAERGKPDFALAYLLVCPLPDAEKREALARSYERRADHTEEQARAFDRQFHRPFPLLFKEANKDRAIAQRIRAGRRIQPDAGRQLPVL